MADRYVSTFGDDVLNDGSSGSPYRTIQKGIDNIGDSNSVILGAEQTFDLTHKVTAVGTGEWNSQYKTLTDASKNFVAAGVVVGDNVFYLGIAYRISVVTEAVLTCTAAPVGDPQDIDYQVGDQPQATIDMDISGSVSGNLWRTLKSASITNRAIIKGSTSVSPLIRVAAAMQQIIGLDI